MSNASNSIMPPARHDAPSWDSAFEAYYGPLCDYVLGFVGSAEAAEELIQDLFLHLWDTRGPGDAARLTRAYLFVAARNRALKYLRHRRVAQAWIDRVSREQPPAAETPEDALLEAELRAAVEQALAELPDRCRTIFLLRRRDHLSYVEIAARAGVSLGTVKSHMWRAAALLREKLAPYLPSYSRSPQGLLT
jgi:RNA polymerase sigma-70 factor (ECF subfamily)